MLYQAIRLNKRPNWVFGIALGVLLQMGGHFAQAQAPTFQWKSFQDSLKRFCHKELNYSLEAIGNSQNDVPPVIFGEPTGGDFSNSALAVTLAALEKMGVETAINGEPLRNWIASYVVKDAKGETFPQLNAMKVAHGWSGNLPFPQTEVYKSLSNKEKAAFKDLATLERGVEIPALVPTKGRPQNYLAVALYYGALAHKAGLLDKSYTIHLQALGRKCVALLKAENGFLDDDKNGRGRFDRYGLEFIRFTYTALDLLGEKKLQRELVPLCRPMEQLWWDMINPQTGYAFPYGRSLQNTWEDSFEQCAFLAQYPELRPAALRDIAGVFRLAWKHYTENQYDTLSHTNRMLDFGRATYSYAGRNRIWGYTVHTFGKAMESAVVINQALEKEKVVLLPITPQLLPVSRLHHIRQGARKMAIWIYRQPNNYFVIPVLGGFANSGSSDYLPIPYGFEGVQAPVNKQVPALVPHFQIKDGSTLLTADGADSISLSKNGRELRIVWRYLPDFSGRLTDPQMKVVSTWKAEDRELDYHLQMTSANHVVLPRWEFWMPVTYAGADLSSGSFFDGTGKILALKSDCDWEPPVQLLSTGNREFGKGSFAYIPLIMKWEATDVALVADKTYSFKLNFRHVGD